MGFLTSNKAADRLSGIASGLRSDYDSLIDDYTGRSEDLMEETMRPFEDEMSTLRKQRNFRDPLQEFALQSGVRQQVRGEAEKASRAAGLGGAARLSSGAAGVTAAAMGYQQHAQMMSQRRQMDSAALSDLMKTGGSIKAQMGMSQLQGITGMRQAQMQGYAQLQAQAAQLMDKPTVWAGFIEGAIAAAGGSGGGLFGGDDTDTDTGGDGR